MKRHKDHGQPKRSRPTHAPRSVDRDMDDLEMNTSLPFQHNKANEEDDDLLINMQGYRDRAAERRREEEENAKSERSTLGGQTKGLDFALLELQRKGIRAVDVLEGDTHSARIKLAAKKIVQLFPTTATDDIRCTGWRIRLSFSSSDQPIKVFDESLAKLDHYSTKSKATHQAKSVFSPDEVQIIMNAWKSRRIRKDKFKSTVDQETIEGDENNDVDYAEEVQELSDEEEQAHEKERLVQKNQVKPKENNVTIGDDEDDDFDMFGGVMKKEGLEVSAKNEVEVTKVDFMSLGLDDLKSILEKIENAILLRKALDNDNQKLGAIKSG